MGTGQLPRHKKPPKTMAKGRLRRHKQSSAPTYAALAIEQWQKEDAKGDEIERRTRAFRQGAKELDRAMPGVAIGTLFNLSVSILVASWGYALAVLGAQILLWLYPLLGRETLSRHIRNVCDLRYNVALTLSWITAMHTEIPNHIDNPFTYRQHVEEIETLGERIQLLLSGRHPS